jgi:phosphoglycerate dehydrogenase-like enzyme
MTIWTNVKLPPAEAERFRREVAGHEILQSAGASQNNLAAGGVDPLLARAEIAFGQPAPEQAMQLPKLRWLQLTTAGYTRYDTREFRDAMKRSGAIVCNASSVYSEPCAQHVLAMMLSLCRRLPMSLDNQRGEHKWPYLPLRAESKLLNGQTVLLVGYGAIARRLAQLLAPFEMNVIGFKRHPAGDDGSVKLLPIAQLDAWLPKADHVVNILPASSETEELFNADRFAKMKGDAFYFNIGRGSTNDEYALWTALETRTIAAAYIDAFMEEPLPPHHALWTMPHCFITPHTAGGHANEYERHVDLFLNNLRRFESGKQDLIDRIM